MHFPCRPVNYTLANQNPLPSQADSSTFSGHTWRETGVRLAAKKWGSGRHGHSSVLMSGEGGKYPDPVSNIFIAST